MHEATTGLKNIGLNMGSNFIKLSELLHINIEKQYFENNNQKIFYIFDVPHLIKATRNILLILSYVDGDKVTSW